MYKVIPGGCIPTALGTYEYYKTESSLEGKYTQMVHEVVAEHEPMHAVAVKAATEEPMEEEEKEDEGKMRKVRRRGPPLKSWYLSRYPC